MKSDKMDIEDLLSDESFINYCKKSSPADRALWESYVQDNPDRLIVVENAKARFIEVFNAMAMADRDEQEIQLTKRLNMIESASIVQMQEYEEKKSRDIFSLLIKFTASVAVVLLAVFLTINYNNSSKKESLKTFVAAYGERKNFQLPDGSIVTLNAGSKINITESYGVSSRDIYLEGEAFFDVKHNKELPFIVHTPAMDVKALGTAFNVKAYPGEKITETSLVRGIVEVTLKEETNRKLMLYPNQKVLWELPDIKTGTNKDTTEQTSEMRGLNDNPVQKIIKTDEGDVKETAWTENKLIFEDESFADIAVLLERWYGVKIEFAEDAIRHYRFTGIFEKEEIGTILSFLKESKSFKYEIIAGEPLKIKLFN